MFTKTRYENKNNDIADFFKETSNPNKMESPTFNYTDVREAIDKLSVSASAGPDGVPAILLKKCK